MFRVFIFLCTLAIAVTSAVGQCKSSDGSCWSRVSLGLANEIRSRRGMSPLEMGYESQQRNADAWAKEIMNRGSLVHQNLREATEKVGCGLLVNTENIAYNYETGNVAAKCMDQWENSDPHLKNILNSQSDMMSVGFSRKSDGSMWCVMTTTMKMESNPSGSLCQTMGGNSGGSDGGSGVSSNGDEVFRGCSIEKSKAPEGKVILRIENRKNVDVKVWHNSYQGSLQNVKTIRKGATSAIDSAHGASYRVTAGDRCLRKIIVDASSGTKNVQIGGFK